MLNFEYKNPVKIHFGKGTISKIAEEIPADAKVLVLYGGGSIKRTGVFDQIKSALGSREFVEFGGIEPNPHYETCLKAIEVVKQNSIDFVLAAGGGSVVDAAKFIVAGACYEGDDPWDFLAYRYVIEVKEAIALGVVLTLPATGSEMNGTSVMTKASTKEKTAFSSPLVMPQFSILDPECVFTLPDQFVANGVVDAFVHVLEQYLTYPCDAPLQDRFAEGILLTLIEEGPKIMKNRSDYSAAANFMWCATMALNGLIGLGVPQDWSTHMIGHELTAFHGIDHARTLAIVLPGILNIKRESKREKLLQYGERIWGITQGTEDQRIDETINKTIEFFNSFGIECTLSAYNVPIESIDTIVDRFKERGIKFGENKDIDYSTVRKILESRFEKDDKTKAIDIDCVSLWDFECVYDFAETVFLFRLKDQNENDRRVLQLNLGRGTYYIDIADRFLKFTPYSAVDFKNESVQNYYRKLITEEMDSEVVLDAMIDFHRRDEKAENGSNM